MAKFIEVNTSKYVQAINIEHIASFYPYEGNGDIQVVIMMDSICYGGKHSIVINEDYRSFTDRLSALADMKYTEDEQ